MNLLLDTHALLWALDEPERLPDAAAEAVRNRRNIVHASAASTWELAIKAGLGKIELPFADLEGAIDATGFAKLPVTVRHTLRVRDLPRHHRDPFDRLLVAQARDEDLVLVTADPLVGRSGARTRWAR